MNLVEIRNFKIMDIGVENANGFVITEKALLDCLHKDGFCQKPIVYNRNQFFKDYRDDKIVKQYCEEKYIGIINDDIVYDYETKEVTATVLIDNDFINKKAYDNWLIDNICTNNKKEIESFTYTFCEIFDKGK